MATTNPITQCSVEGCERPAHARGWCSTHYSRWYTTGTTDLLEREAPVCEVEGCGRSDKIKKGLCPLHYARMRRHGTVEVPERRTRKCSVEGCENKHLAKGFCNRHYKMNEKYGDPNGGRWEVATSIRDAFDMRTEWDEETGCLNWTGARSEEGYGQQWFRGRVWPVHRIAWTLVNGEIPEGLFVNHLCWNTSCVNVEHLNLMTLQENNFYRSGPAAHNRSGYRNVYWDPRLEFWYVVVKRDGKVHYKGGFKTAEEAAVYAEQLRQEVLGEFAGKG